ncbi:MAG: TetR/AcrR family transcriptional regulator [Chloroflexota bacterium]
MSRKTKYDWFVASVQILNTQGHQSLTIDALTKKLGVTKGSFYHHFGSLKQFKTALLAHFEEAGTLQIIEQTEEATTSQAKLYRLVAIVSEQITSSPSNLEVGLRAWARQEPEVGELLARVDAQRIAYVQNLFNDIFNDSAKAQKVSELFYIVLIGSEHVFPPLAQTHLSIYLTELLHLYGVKNE